MGVAAMLRGAQAMLEQADPLQQQPAGGVYYPTGWAAPDTLDRIQPAFGNAQGAPPAGTVIYSDYYAQRGALGPLATLSDSNIWQLANLPVMHALDLTIRTGIIVSQQTGTAYIGMSDVVVGVGPAPNGAVFYVPGGISPQPLPQGLRAGHESYPAQSLSSGQLVWTSAESSYLKVHVQAGQSAWVWQNILVYVPTTCTAKIDFFYDVIGQAAASYSSPGAPPGGASPTAKDIPAPRASYTTNLGNSNSDLPGQHTTFGQPAPGRIGLL